MSFGIVVLAFAFGAALFAADVWLLHRMARNVFGKKVSILVVVLFCARLLVLGGLVYLAVTVFRMNGVALAFGAASILAAIAWRAWRADFRSTVPAGTFSYSLRTRCDK